MDAQEQTHPCHPHPQPEQQRVESSTPPFPRNCWTQKDDFLQLLYRTKLALDQAEEETP